MLDSFFTLKQLFVTTSLFLVPRKLFSVYSPGPYPPKVYLFITELRRSKGPPSGAPYPYRKEKETHELIFSWLSWLAVFLVGAYARRRRRRRSHATCSFVLYFRGPLVFQFFTLTCLPWEWEWTEKIVIPAFVF